MHFIKTNNDYSRCVIILIFISFILRIVLASFTELNNDEVYYWTYSQHLQWNYFDHPPMVALWIRIFTGNLLLQKFELFIRAGSLISCAASTWILFILGKELQSERVGWFIACLYNTSIYASIISGVFIMPDSPQMLFWCISLLLICRLFNKEKSWPNWLLLGIFAGLCIMSKIHGVFIWFGLGLFILTNKRQWLKLPQLYVAFFITIAIISPIFFWNISNQFITYKFHSGRVAINSFALQPQSFLTELFGEILYNNPINVVIIVSATIFFIKSRNTFSQAASVFLFIGIPMIVTLLIISLFRDTLPHWSGPAYVALLPIAGIYIATKNKGIVFTNGIRAAFLLILFVGVAGLILINFYPGTFGNLNSNKIGENDFTLDMNGWKDAGKQFAIIQKDDVKNKRMPADANMVCYKWFPAAHEQFYFCYSISMEMVGLGKPFDLHQYLWYNEWVNAVMPDKSYCVIPSNEWYDPVEKYSSYYNKIQFNKAIFCFRNKKISRVFYVYDLSGWKGKIPTANSFGPY